MSPAKTTLKHYCIEQSPYQQKKSCWLTSLGGGHGVGLAHVIALCTAFNTHTHTLAHTHYKAYMIQYLRGVALRKTQKVEEIMTIYSIKKKDTGLPTRENMKHDLYSSANFTYYKYSSSKSQCSAFS